MLLSHFLRQTSHLQFYESYSPTNPQGSKEKQSPSLPGTEQHKHPVCYNGCTRHTHTFNEMLCLHLIMGSCTPPPLTAGMHQRPLEHITVTQSPVKMIPPAQQIRSYQHFIQPAGEIHPDAVMLERQLEFQGASALTASCTVTGSSASCRCSSERGCTAGERHAHRRGHLCY